MRRTLIGIAVLALALVAGVRWLVSTGAIAESIRARVIAEAARALGREIAVDRLSGDPFRGVTLTGIRVSGPPGAATGPFFASERIVVSFDPGRLLRDLTARRGVLSSITRVEVDRPHLSLARDAQGRWNYADLLARQRGVPPTPPPFRAMVEVREGSLVFFDALRLPQRAGPRPPSPFAAHFDRITGTLDFGGAPRVGMALKAVNTDGLTPALLEVTGVTSLGEATFDLDLSARGGSVDYWGPYIVRLPWLVWGGGTFDGTMHLLASRWGGAIALDYRGTLTLRDGKALLLPRKTLLSDIDGPLAVDNLGVTTEGLTMAVDASPLWVRGTVLHHAGVSLDLALRSPSLDLRTLQAVLFPQARLRLSGQAGGTARVTGAFAAPRVEAEIVSAAGRINQQSFAGTSGRLTYYGGTLVFDDVTASAAGGQVRGHARVDLGAGTYFVLADARSVDLRGLVGLGLRIDPALEGRTSGVVAAAADRQGIIAQGRAAMGRGMIYGLGFDALETLFGYDHGRIEVDRLSAQSGTTRLRASGQVSPAGGLALSLSGLDVNLRTFAGRFGLGDWLAGMADVAGRVEGTVRAPALVGTVRARAGRLGPFPFDQARGRIRITTTELSTPGVLLFDGPGRYFAAGTVRWAGRPAVDLTARAADLPAQRLLEIAEVPVDIGGIVETAVRLSGPLQAPVAEGTARLRDGHIEGQRVDAAEAAFRWTGSALLLDRFAARTNSSLIEARGTVSRTGELGITFSATGLRLSDVAALRSEAVEVAGRADLAGTLGGSIRAPTVSAAVTSSDLVLNGQLFTRAEGVVRYRRGILQLTSLNLSQDGGGFSLAGEIGLRDDPTLNLRIGARDARLATLLGLGRVRPPFALDGTITGTVVANGPLSNLRASLDVALADGRLGDQPIQEATIRADLSNHAVTLGTFRILPARGELVGAGRVDLRGRSEVEFGGTGLPIELLRPVFGIRRPLIGTMDFALQMSGELNDPLVGLSVSAGEGAIGAATFDRLLVQAFYRNGQLNVEQGLFQEDRHKVRLTGTVPFNPARLRFDESRPMNLRLELVDSDLSALGLLTDRVEQASGPLAGDVAITGTVARPHLEGTLGAENGTVKLRGIDPALTAVTGQAALSEDVMRITKLTARAGDGEVSLTGTVGIRNFRPDRLALQLSATGARLEIAPYYAGLAAGTLTIAGTAGRPEVSGSVTLSGGDLFIPAAGRPQVPANGPSGLNPVLNVEVRAGDALWVNVGGLRLQVHGTVQTTGTWRTPRLAGEATAERGTFVAFNNTFTVTEGRATFAEFRGTTPFVDAVAQTRINVIRPAISGTGGRVETVRVFLHVTGTPDALTLALSSDPPLPRDEIIAGLARQVGVTRLFAGESLESILRAELSNALFGSVGRAVARALGLEEFAITYDFEAPLTVRIGKLVLRDLYVTLTSEFGNPTRTVWALEYRLSPLSMLTYSVDNFGVWEFLYRITYRF